MTRPAPHTVRHLLPVDGTASGGILPSASAGMNPARVTGHSAHLPAVAPNYPGASASGAFLPGFGRGRFAGSALNAAAFIHHQAVDAADNSGRRVQLFNGGA